MDSFDGSSVTAQGASVISRDVMSSVYVGRSDTAGTVTRGHREASYTALRANGGGAGVQVLAAQVSRLATDLDEGVPWRNAGAVLAARLRSAA